jgi:hypothetical protein
VAGLPPKAAAELEWASEAAFDPKQTSIRLSKIAFEHSAVSSNLIEIQR